MASSDLGVARIHVFPPDQQGSGSFDGGKITEIKPIGFPGEGSAQSRIGPLFYWALATAEGPSTIALHPHRGFEIASYVLQGEIGHYDTGGHSSRIGAGGIQAMQTGSGISHEESTFEGRTEFFQIWFEPDLEKALTRPPTYQEYTHEELPVGEVEGVRVKSVIGGQSPVQLVVDAQMEHWILAPHAVHEFGVKKGRRRALVATKGAFAIHSGDERTGIQSRDFVVITSGENNLRLIAEDAGAEAAVIDVPAEVSYPLLQKS